MRFILVKVLTLGKLLKGDGTYRLWYTCSAYTCTNMQFFRLNFDV